MGVFRYVLYAAVAVSLGVYAYRAYRRWIAPDDGDAPPAGTAVDASSTAAGPSVPMPGSSATAPPAVPPADKPARSKRGLGFTDPRSLPSERESGGESLVQEVIREELARKRGTAPTGSPPGADAPAEPGRTGLFAGSSGTRPEDRVTVAAALTGVRLPDDLVPLIGDAAQPDPHHVTFLSSTTPAAAIGRHLGDELERVGYQVRSESDVVAIATKGTVTLRVTLHTDAAAERLDGVVRYPTAPPTGVVVEFET